MRSLRLGVSAPAAAIAMTAALLSSGAGTAAHATAVAPPADEVTWAVRPSDGTAADGRTRIELELDPGESVVEHVLVTNLGDAPARFALSAADGYFTAQGRFNMLPAGEESVDAGTWIELDGGSVDIAPDQSAVVAVRVTVPENATPGDHPAGVAASVISSAQAADGSTLGVESRVGVRLMTRVVGELAPALALSGVSVRYDTDWNPFAPGAVRVDYTAENAGNTRLAVRPAVTAAGQSAPVSQDDVELFPGDARELTAEVSSVWPLGFATVDVALSGDVLPDATSAAPAAAATQVIVWTVPWPQLAVLAGAGLLVLTAMAGRRRRRAEIERLIADAREEGTRGVAAGEPAS